MEAQRPEWFHGGMETWRAEALLKQYGMEDGLFIVRENGKGELILSMAFNVSAIVSERCRLYGPSWQSMRHRNNRGTGLPLGSVVDCTLPPGDAAELELPPEPLSNITGGRGQR